MNEVMKNNCDPSTPGEMLLVICVIVLIWGWCKAGFLKLFSSGDHFYYSECSTDHPTLVRFESKLFEILNYSVWYAIYFNFYFFCLCWTNVQSKRTTRAEPEDHLWSADHSLRNAGVRGLSSDGCWYSVLSNMEVGVKGLSSDGC
jgi:hypothetical protein